MSAAIIFGLLVLLMLTGMPISIALGLTVLSFLFFMTTVPIEIGGAKTVHRHREVRDHGDPVLHSRRQLPHPWRRRETNDRVRANDDRPLGGRPRHCRHDGGGAVFRGVRIVAGDGGRHRFDHAAGDVVGRLSPALCRRRHRHRRRARQSDSAVDHHGDLFGGDERRRLLRPERREGRLRLGRAVVHGRHGAGRDPCDHAVDDHVVSRVEK